MCGRFGSSFNGDDLFERFGLIDVPPKFTSSFNTAPSYSIPIIIRNSPVKAVLAKWGFIPSWADPTKLKIHPINARDDKLDGGFYIEAFKNSRCIIPFSWFYEWKRVKLEKKEEKLPYLIKVKDEKVMGFAGIYSEKKDAEGKIVFTTAIITTKPNKLMKSIHDRMPVILEKEMEHTWLNHESDIKTLNNLLNPYDTNKMEAFRIDKKVGSPSNDGEDIIRPIV